MDHDITDNQIESLYPYDNRRFCKEKYKDKCFTVTYDPHTALVLRTNNVLLSYGGRDIKIIELLCSKKNVQKQRYFDRGVKWKTQK